MMHEDNEGSLALLKERIKDHLEVLYPVEDVDVLADSIIYIMRYEDRIEQPMRHTNLWDQNDVVTITYANTISQQGETPLVTLKKFANERLDEMVSIIHILPFYPWSSDDGFAVIDYAEVSDVYGTWKDINDIAWDFKLMADLVINHVSSESEWFMNYQKDKVPGKGYFVQCNPDTDLSRVVRPRTSSLLRETDTVRGKRHVWCTFSHDQVDLNFANPEVLLEFTRIIKLYLDQGVRVFRLDAIAFLWKTLGTECINLSETHEMVRLLRTLIEHVDAGAILITETNIPNRENLSYFGNANEAHLIYNFALPPLVLYTMLSGNAHHLKQWMMSMPPAQNGTAYFNFIASHDGIGLRPVEGMLSEETVDKMVDMIRDFGGEVSWRSLDDDIQRPYELNISLFDAMKGTFSGEDGYQLDRFICAHAIMLALEGIPAFYIHSLFATPSDHEKMERRNNKRSINRHEWDYDELCAVLDEPGSVHSQAFEKLRELVLIRKGQPAFHPNAIQFTMHFDDALFAFWRQSNDRSQSIFCIYNVTNKPRELSLQDVNLVEMDDWHNLVGGRHYTDQRGTLHLQPYEFVWISNRRIE